MILLSKFPNSVYQFISNVPNDVVKPQYREDTVEPLSSATCPLIFMQLTGQNNGGTARSAFLLARKGN